MNELITKIEKLRPEKSYHNICFAGSTVSHIDTWGREEIFPCAYKGRNDWGKHFHEVSPCQDCNGKLKGFLDLRVRDSGYDQALSDVIRILTK